MNLSWVTMFILKVNQVEKPDKKFFPLVFTRGKRPKIVKKLKLKCFYSIELVTALLFILAGC